MRPTVLHETETKTKKNWSRDLNIHERKTYETEPVTVLHETETKTNYCETETKTKKAGLETLTSTRENV